MTAQLKPTIEDMIAELKAAGWRQRMIGIWSSPKGKLFHGPAFAYKVMKGASVS